MNNKNFLKSLTASTQWTQLNSRVRSDSESEKLPLPSADDNLDGVTAGTVESVRTRIDEVVADSVVRILSSKGVSVIQESTFSTEQRS